MRAETTRRVLVAFGLFLCGCSETPEEVFERGYAAFQRSDNRELQHCLKLLDASDPDSDRARLLKSLVSNRGGDHLTSLTLMSEIDSDGPLRRLVLLHGGAIYHETGRLRDAARLLALLTREFPDDLMGHRLAGTVYYDLGAYDFAIVHLDRVTELEPGDYRPWWLLGTMYLDFNRYNDAAEALFRSLEFSPPGAKRREITEQLASALISSRRYSDALKVMDGVFRSPGVLAYRAECYASLGDLNSASKAIEDALRLDGKNRAALLYKGKMLRSAGKNEEALQIFAGLVERDSFDVESRYQYALLLNTTGDGEESEIHMQEWQRQNALADALTKKNRLALDRPFDTELQIEIADLCEQLGKTELAEMWRRVASGSQRPNARHEAILPDE